MRRTAVGAGRSLDRPLRSKARIGGKAIPFRLSAAAAALLVLTSAPVVAKPPVLLAPSTKWHLNYSEDSCQLTRGFGTGADQVFLYLEQFAPGPLYQARLIGRPFRNSDRIAKLTIAADDGKPMVFSALTGTMGDKQPMLVFSIPILAKGAPGSVGLAAPAAGGGEQQSESPPAFVVDGSKQGNEVRINPPGAGPDLVLQVGPMLKAVVSMQTCMDELLTHWGIDAVAHKTLQRLPKPLNNPGRWMTTDDYPEGALRGGESAVVNFRVTVASDGRVSGCAIQRATRGPEFVKRTCELIRQRARFEPALDATGKPIASYYVNAVQWLISR